MSVPMAIALSGHQLLGQPVMVNPSEAEKNLVQSTAVTGGSGGLAGPYGAVARKLYIGNLHFNMTEDKLRQVFEPFGPVELVQLPLDLETGQCKGFGFVQFAQLEHAKAAQSLNGKLEIAGRVIKVSAVTEHVGVQNAGANAADFDDDDDGGGLSLNAQSRAMLMQKLDRTGITTSYIDIYDAMSVPMAIALSGHQLLGQPVMVKPSEAEKNLVQSTAVAGGSGGLAGPYGAVARKLYIGNLHFNMTEDQLKQVFEPFGPVELVQLPLDIETGQCKGFGFVQFAQLEHAKAAQSLNGKLEIAGRVIKVSAVTDHVGVQNTGANAADFDDGGGLSLNAQSRAMLMQKLDRFGIATSITGSLGVPLVIGQSSNQPTVGLPTHVQAALAPSFPALAVSSPVIEPVGNPSECLLLKNMFDPNTETHPDFDMDIKDEVQEECSTYGPVKHIYVDKNSAGYVYLRFETVAASAGYQRAMHMRWFARRLISAIFMQPYEYEAKFGGDH